jgi:predicted ATP-grasp superfamily ATP-dependent carboligase
MKNVLVFPCGSEIGLEVYKSLCFSTHFDLFGGSSVEDHGQYVYENYIGSLPFVDDQDFIKKINEVIDTYKIDYIIPAHDSVILRLAEAADAGEIGCEVITSNLITCEVSRSKSRTYDLLKNKVELAKVFESIDGVKDNEYPVFLKPDVGQGSKGTVLAKTPEEARFYIAKDPTLLILEYLPGDEYTVDCFTDRSGELRFCEGRKRNRIAGGISVNSSTVIDPRFEEIANIINGCIEFRGVWFFQVKVNSNGKLALMEIAPRIAGTMGLVRAKGVNLVLLSLFDRLGFDIEVIENSYDMTIDRALQNVFKHNIKYSHVYIDYDDLIIYRSKVNPVIIRFLYQSINNGLQLHLITRHGDDLQSSLETYRLQNLFDEVIRVKDGDHKYQYIKEKDSIFIDDSFEERSAVAEHLKIPVFDAHMVDGLMETD